MFEGDATVVEREEPVTTTAATADDDDGDDDAEQLGCCMMVIMDGFQCGMDELLENMLPLVFYKWNMCTWPMDPLLGQAKVGCLVYCPHLEYICLDVSMFCKIPLFLC